MIHLVGIAAGKTLPAEDAELLRTAAHVAGAPAILDALGVPEEKRLPMGRDMAALGRRLRELSTQGQGIVVVANGDPLFFGLGASLLPHLCQCPTTVHPAPACLQLLAAALKRPWWKWRVTSLHGRDDVFALLASLTHAQESFVLTDPKHDPAWIGTLLAERGADESFILHVGECLGLAEERIQHLSPAAAAHASFRQPNVVLAERLGPGPAPSVDGVPLSHDGTISKTATRALAMALLAPGPQAVFWDAGAGAGTMALEAAARISHGMVFALEHSPQRLAAIHTNRVHARAWMVEIVPGPMAQTAPTLPRPSHIFWGGGITACNLEVLRQCLRPGGRMVASFVRLEVLEMLRQHAPRLGLTLSLHHLQHSHAEPLAGGTRLVPANPVFLALMEKPA
ncbi:MAG: precorrin-6y C5,15-methyltransferase (decarboxylating) subunit CbiE [Desulfomicrobiaceae bacterium]